MAVSHATACRREWTVDEYHRAADAGIFGPEERLELIEGDIIRMSPQDSPHSVGIGNTERALEAAFGPGFWVRTQLPLHLGERSEPEPDVAVVPGVPNDYVAGHPTTALLLVEVAESSLDCDRTLKAQLYARHGVGEYWILDLVNRRLIVHRDPVLRPEACYKHVSVLEPQEAVAVPCEGGARIRVEDLLPVA